MKDEVIFKKSKDAEIIAFFPYQPANPGRIAFYDSQGGHGEAALEYYWGSTRPATQEEYASLKSELETYYEYDLKIVHRINHTRRNAAARAYWREAN